MINQWLVVGVAIFWYFLKKRIWVTTNWPAGPQQNRRVQVWRKFLRNNDFNHLRSIWKSQIDLELISRGNIEAEENWEPLWTQKCPQKASSPPKLGRRNALQIGVATVNLRMAVTPVRSLATTMRRLAPRTWAGHVGQASWPGYEGCHWQWWELLYSKGHFDHFKWVDHRTSMGKKTMLDIARGYFPKIWVCLKIVYPIVPNGFADPYPYNKWLAIIGNIHHFQTNPKILKLYSCISMTIRTLKICVGNLYHFQTNLIPIFVASIPINPSTFLQTPRHYCYAIPYDDFGNPDWTAPWQDMVPMMPMRCWNGGAPWCWKLLE